MEKQLYKSLTENKKEIKAKFGQSVDYFEKNIEILCRWETLFG